MAQTFRGTAGAQLMLLPALALMIVVLGMNVDLGSFSRPTAWGWFAAAMIDVAIISTIAYLIRRPTLTIDDDGLAFGWIIGSWSLRWDEVLLMKIKNYRRGPATIAFSVLEGASAHSRINRLMCGYDRLLPNYWGMPLSECEALIQEAMDRSRRPAETAWSPSPTPRTFGRRIAPN